MITTTSEWFTPDEKLPDENGEYFVVVDRPVYDLKIIIFTKNLYKFSRFDFPDESYSRPGFVDVRYDENDYWYYDEIPLSHILYWTKIPKFKEEQ